MKSVKMTCFCFHIALKIINSFAKELKINTSYGHFLLEPHIQEVLQCVIVTINEEVYLVDLVELHDC